VRDLTLHHLARLVNPGATSTQPLVPLVHSQCLTAQGSRALIGRVESANLQLIHVSPDIKPKSCFNRAVTFPMSYHEFTLSDVQKYTTTSCRRHAVSRRHQVIICLAKRVGGSLASDAALQSFHEAVPASEVTITVTQCFWQAHQRSWPEA
jgi:hypothetical protein